MAFPAIAATNTSTGASGTSHTVNLPTGIAAGNLLVIVFGGVGAATTTFPADWTRLGGGGTSGTLDVAWKIATGTEGSSIVVTTGATSITSNHKSYRITGGDRVVIGTNVTISSSATADPPSLTPGWWASSQDILWLAISMANTQTTVSTYPTSFSNGAVVTNGSTGLATCDRNVNGTLLDPAAFTWGGTGRKNTNTVAIKPGIVVVPSPEDLENYADSWIAIRTLTQTQTADDLENYADSDTVDKQTAAGGPTPKTVNLTADPWGNLADQQPTIDSRGNLSISLTTDALNNWAEQLAHSKSYALPVDTMTLADQPVIVSQGAALAVSPPADSLNNWADQLAHSKSYALSADSMTLADQPATINLASPNLQANLSADSLQNWADNYSRSQAYNLTGDLMVLADQPVAV